MIKRRCYIASRTNLFAAVRRALQQALPASDATMPRGERREFLKRAVAASALLGCGVPVLAGCGRSAPRVAIIGAGLAGLNAAYTLQKGGLACTVYEAGARIGGRIQSARDVLFPGHEAELGGEFIDAQHADLLGLAKEFNLDLLDRGAAPGQMRTAWFFEGEHRSEAQLVEGLKPFARRFATDAAVIGEILDHRQVNDAARAIDALSVSSYLQAVGLSGWVRSLLEAACIAEFGMDAAQQSALNLLTLIGRDDLTDGSATLRDFDRRFVIKGGNEQVIAALAQRVAGPVELQQRLRILQRKRSEFLLTFQRKGGDAHEVRADVVILALPFSVLRDVNLDLPLPDIKRKAIAELGYGSHAKILVGFERRVWRATQYSGAMLTDEPLQCCWEHTAPPAAGNAGLTLLIGGRPGMEVGHDAVEKQVNRLVIGVERAFPGGRAARTLPLFRAHWPTAPHSKGSVACYKVGQWTALAGAESQPVDSLFFAGEHCSRDFPRTMNGAAESGRRVAETVLAALR